jgi:hypothetical protein
MSSTPALPPRLVTVIGSLLAYPRVWLNPVLGIFKPLEDALLRELVARSEPAVAAAVAAQLPRINKVVRVTAGTSESNLYRATPFGVDKERPQYLPEAAPESVVARIAFQANGSKRITAKFWALHGRLFSIDFNADVRALLSCGDPQVLDFHRGGTPETKP